MYGQGKKVTSSKKYFFTLQSKLCQEETNKQTSMSLTTVETELAFGSLKIDMPIERASAR